MLIVEGLGWADRASGVMSIRWNQTTHFYYGVHQLPTTPYEIALYRPHPYEKYASSPVYINARNVFPSIDCVKFNRKTVTRAKKKEETIVENLEIICERIYDLAERQLLYIPASQKQPKQHGFFERDRGLKAAVEGESASHYQSFSGSL